MQSCELCGRERELVNSLVEGAKLKLCAECSSYGKIIEEKKADKNKAYKREIDIEELIENYGSEVKNAREKLGITQQELAMRLNEKVSIITNIERMGIKPTMETAKKLERSLGITLTVKILNTNDDNIKHGEKHMTIGDAAKIN